MNIARRNSQFLALTQVWRSDAWATQAAENAKKLGTVETHPNEFEYDGDMGREQSDIDRDNDSRKHGSY